MTQEAPFAVPEPDLPAANLTVTTAHTSTLNDTLTVPAHIEANPVQLVHVFAPLSGRITELKVMLRPASALQAVGARMAEEFARLGVPSPA